MPYRKNKMEPIVKLGTEINGVGTVVAIKSDHVILLTKQLSEEKISFTAIERMVC